MSIVTTPRAVDLSQLGIEVAAAAGLPGPVELSMKDKGTERIVTCDVEAVTQTILDDCIDVHVPGPPPPTEGEGLQAQIDELADMMMGP
jgi:hypothetical protein